MTFTITIPTLALPGGFTDTMRSMLPLLELVAFAIAGAGGAGILLHLGLNIGFKLVHHVLKN